MTNEREALTDRMMMTALAETDDPSAAATVLMSAAARILQERFGEEIALAALSASVDSATTAWRQGRMQ